VALHRHRQPHDHRNPHRRRLVGGNKPELHRTLDRAAAVAEGCFDGPPYAIAEHIFDKSDIESCTAA
jgi:hypothetical protein